jgi:hypothetical protein
VQSTSSAEVVSVAASDHFDEAALLVSPASRTLRRQLRALAWMTLEEVALDAVAEEGRLVAQTSARRVAENLAVDPGTAAAALRVLRDSGLVMLERGQGPAGRFGLSVYVLGSLAGLTVVAPGAGFPHVDLPSLGNPDVEDTDRLVPLDGRGADRPGIARPRTAAPHTAGPRTGEPPSPPSLQCPGQEAFELGTASS